MPYKLNFIIKGACLSGLLVFFTSCTPKQAHPTDPAMALRQVYLEQIDSCLYYINSIATGQPNQQNYQSARTHFKQMEPLLAFVDKNNYSTLNGPNLLKVEEEDLTNIRVQQPEGFQVMEEHLYNENIDSTLIQHKARFITSRLELIKKNIDLSKFKPYHFLWMVRDQIIRTATTGITGFDSPVRQSSMEEAQITYRSLLQFITFYKNEFHSDSLYRQWLTEINQTINDLSVDFDLFDRYRFIKTHTHTQLRLWTSTANDWQVTFPFELAISNVADNLFSPTTFNLAYFSGKHQTANENTIALGKQLFYDPNLSGGGNMSCSSCHQPERAFTDGLPTSVGNGGESLKRNSPTLLYAGLQKGFFYDKRTGNLEGQIVGVVTDEHEFHTDLQTLETAVNNNFRYRQQFTELYPDSVTEGNIRHAIASYVRSLAPFQSKFDRNMRHEEETLTYEEIFGFNLFMGKAGCATCHFPPLFNGTVPPRFKESEMEALGVPLTSTNQTVDTDLGRYDIFQTPERKHFFKTPTIRNIENTAPYMHNGIYNSLEQVLEFYNVGGGLGLGFDLEHQTLPPDSLHLTREEQQAIIAFMKTLTDPVEEGY